jgi:hypothetical protein
MQLLPAGLALLGAVIVTVVVLPLAGSTPASASTGSKTAQARPSCSLSVERMRIGSRLARKTVRVGVRCNFEVIGLGLRTSAPLRKVRRAADVAGGVPGDRLTCSRRWPPVVGLMPRRAKRKTLAGCVGVTGYNVRSTITVAMRKAVCAPRRLRVRVAAFGGIDCRGSLYPCPAVGYHASAARTVVGC